MTAAKRGTHKSVLTLDSIEMMHSEVDGKVKDGFAELGFLDEIEHLLETVEWSHLKISPISMVPHKSRKIQDDFRSIFIFKGIWYGDTVCE